jgi:hypothetical protein
MQYIAIAPIFWAKSAVALVAFAATIPAVRLLIAPLKKLLNEDAELDTEALIGCIAVTDVGEVRINFGRAIVVVNEQEHVVEVRCKEGVITPRGVMVRLVDFDSSGNFFWVEQV